MVISVDTGNKMIKTEHYEFNSGIDVLDTIPGENDEVIEFGGKYYRTTNRRISYMEDKTEDDRYYILTLIAIAKELDTMKKEAVLAPNELIEIELLVGLPPAHYGKYRKKFQQYFQRDGKVVGFKYGGTSYQILIHEVKVYVQAYAAYCVLAARRHLTELPKVLVIDIGGFTVDYMILRYGRLEKEHVDSLESGVICLYGRIRAAIRQKYSIALDEEDIDNIILGKNTGYMQELKERVREVTIGYVTELLGTFRELGIFLMLDIVYLAIQEKGRKKCPECDSEISKKVRICPECGYLFQQGLSEEQLTGYIEQEQEKEMSSEQIDRAFEKTDNIAADEIDSFDGDINDFLQE